MKFTREELELFRWVGEGCRCCCCSLLLYITVRKESCPCYPGTGDWCYGCLDQVLGRCNSPCNIALRNQMDKNEKEGDPEDEEQIEDDDTSFSGDYETDDIEEDEDDGNPDFVEEHKIRGTYEGLNKSSLTYLKRFL